MGGLRVAHEPACRGHVLTAEGLADLVGDLAVVRRRLVVAEHPARLGEEQDPVVDAREVRGAFEQVQAVAHRTGAQRDGRAQLGAGHRPRASGRLGLVEERQGRSVAGGARLGGAAHQREMALVERAHRGHEANRAALGPRCRNGGAHILLCVDDPHLELTRRYYTRLRAGAHIDSPGRWYQDPRGGDGVRAGAPGRHGLRRTVSGLRAPSSPGASFSAASRQRFARRKR